MASKMHRLLNTKLLDKIYRVILSCRNEEQFYVAVDFAWIAIKQLKYSRSFGDRLFGIDANGFLQSIEWMKIKLFILERAQKILKKEYENRPEKPKD